jgi:ABC-type tungstate transport system permease subunit
LETGKTHFWSRSRQQYWMKGEQSGHVQRIKAIYIDCDADVLLVHSPAAEKKFMEDGFGVNRRLVMHNDFIIVGTSDDPAKIKGLKSAAEAFKKIAAAGKADPSKVKFVSRGDNSGTHGAENGYGQQRATLTLPIFKSNLGILKPDRAWGRL